MEKKKKDIKTTDVKRIQREIDRLKDELTEIARIPAYMLGAKNPETHEIEYTIGIIRAALTQHFVKLCKEKGSPS